MDCSSYKYQMDHTTTCIGKAVPQLQTPAFLVDLKKATKNCQAMKDSCKSLGLAFRPTTSTHRTQYVYLHFLTFFFDSVLISNILTSSSLFSLGKVLNSRQWSHRNVSCVGVYMKSSILPIMVLMTFFLASSLSSKTFPGL